MAVGGRTESRDFGPRGRSGHHEGMADTTSLYGVHARVARSTFPHGPYALRIPNHNRFLLTSSRNGGYGCRTTSPLLWLPCPRLFHSASSAFSCKVVTPVPPIESWYPGATQAQRWSGHNRRYVMTMRNSRCSGQASSGEPVIAQ